MRANGLISSGLACAALGLVWTSPAHAGYTFDDVIVEQWVGEGEHEAMLVTDFDDQSFAFGYRFAESSVTGWDLMQAIEAYVAGFALDYEPSGESIFIQDIHYHDDSAGTSTDMDLFTGVWTADDGQSWIASEDEGITDIQIEDQGWLGTSVEVFDPDVGELINTPTTPIPEPSTAILVGMGSLALLMRGRRSP